MCPVASSGGERHRFMGRKATHRVVKDHPSPRFAGKIKLMNFVRGPWDEGWHAQFRINDAWAPKTPVSLSTKDWEEAVEVSREKHALAVAGHAVVIPRKPAAVVNPF